MLQTEENLKYRLNNNRFFDKTNCQAIAIGYKPYFQTIITRNIINNSISIIKIIYKMQFLALLYGL